MLAEGSMRRAGSWTLAVFWAATLALLLGCSEVGGPMDARALRRQFPEQADAVLQGPFAFTAAGDGFEALRPPNAQTDGHADVHGEAGLRPSFPQQGDGAVRFPLPDGAEALVRELGAAGEAAVADNAVAYARRGGASFWTALEDGYEEWLLLEPSAVRRDAPVATWQVDGAALRQDGAAVELADARGTPQLRVTAPEAYAAGGRPVDARLVARGRQIELWVDAEGETVLVDPRWRPVREMNSPRYRHTATPLPDGRVLVVGGYHRWNAHDSAELFDPASGEWSVQGSMSAARADHTATLLPDGRVLVIGGDTGGTEGDTAAPDLAGALDSIEVFDPGSGQASGWSTGDPMKAARADHTATLLSDGRIFVAGGYGPEGALDSAELFDPSSGRWSTLQPMRAARTAHTATLLSDGRVLVAGGEGGDGVLDSAELFDPRSGRWSTLQPMRAARTAHTATLLEDGRVLVVGGADPDSAPNDAELFDPGTGTWLTVRRMAAARTAHTATLLPDGRVLITGGDGPEGSLDGVEVFDPGSGRWLSLQSMQRSRAEHTAALLPDGRVLVAGGSVHGTIDDAELLDPDVGMWRSVAPLHIAREEHTATLLQDGRVLVAAGTVGSGGPHPGARVDVTEVFDPDSGTWHVVGPIGQVRTEHTATLLQDGRVLLAGGSEEIDDQPGKLRSLTHAELFDPGSGTWQPASPMNIARYSHTATLLQDGRVLVAGGRNQQGTELPDSAELYDPASDRWMLVEPMLAPRQAHTATLLLNGQVLVAGGYSPDGVLDGAEVFDPGSGGWLPLGAMISARSVHTATLLPDGRVLVAGGFDAAGDLDSAEVFIPDSGRWLPLGTMHTARIDHTATLLPDGRVLVLGGANVQAFTLQPHTVEAFDPSSGAWFRLEPLPLARYFHSTTLLKDGGVLVAGGGDEGALDSVVLFRPMSDGSPCAADVECSSGHCTDGVCCERACDVYLCEACSALRGASADGVCTSLHPDYVPFACSPQTGERMEPCASVHHCADGFVCDEGGECVPPPQSGGFLAKGGCRLAIATAAEPAGRAPAELGLLTLAAASAALRRRRR
ncbi:kelch repeat-containing protein [Sorangium sp. So ce406]|uniref:kelch repeat-containing protein n=1 Tax=Sorangium sp. So ce406 TaxID=3133311 RepID=UPI003F5B3FD6